MRGRRVDSEGRVDNDGDEMDEAEAW